MKKYYIILVLIVIYISGAYLLSLDESNKYSKFIKDNTPIKFKSIVKETLFFIPYSKREIKKLDLIAQKLSEDNRILILERDKYKNLLNSGSTKREKINYNNYEFSSTVIPFNDTLDLFANKKNGYIEIYKEHIIIFFASGKIIFVNKNKFYKGEFDYFIVKSNLNQNKLFNQKLKWTGIKDIVVVEDDLFISLTDEITENCYITSIYKSKISKTFMNFKKIFRPNECFSTDKEIKAFKYFDGYQTGGRIVTNKNKLYVTLGDYNYWKEVQSNKSYSGKILEINKDTDEVKIISKGHRNPQGLLVLNDQNLLISTEHGPKGGDEINVIKLSQEKIQNFGWPISSYGNHYDVVPINSYVRNFAPLHKSHKKYGFIEPLKYYEKSIGISEIIKNHHHPNSFFVTSLKKKSIFEIELDKNLNFKRTRNIIEINERIRDIIYDKQKKCYLIYGENTPKLISMCLI